MLKDRVHLTKNVHMIQQSKTMPRRVQGIPQILESLLLLGPVHVFQVFELFSLSLISLKFKRSLCLWPDFPTLIDRAPLTTYTMHLPFIPFIFIGSFSLISWKCTRWPYLLWWPDFPMLKDKRYHNHTYHICLLLYTDAQHITNHKKM